MITLGSTTLNPHLRLRGLESAPPITTSATTSFDGTVDVLTMAAPITRRLSLVALRTGRGIEGFFTLAQLDSIRAIAAAGQPTTLVHDRGSFTVLITGLVDIEPVIDYRNPTAAAIYVGSVELQEI